MEVKIKRLHPDAVIPTKAHDTDAGFDLTATSWHYDEFGNLHLGFGLAFEIPRGHAGFIFPRSSQAKHDLIMANCVGVIDSAYRGEVTAKFKRAVSVLGTEGLRDYTKGDRVAQLIILPYPEVEFAEVDQLSYGERGDNSYGSSGK